MVNTLLRDRIDARLAALGISANKASVRATRKPDLIRDIRSGKTRYPRYDTMKRLALALECSVAYLTGDDENVSPSGEVHASDRARLIRRLKAARWAWEPSAEKAAQALGVRADQLLKIEAGTVPARNDFLVRFCEVSQTPFEWLLLGSGGSMMEPERSVRIALTEIG